MTRKRTTVVRRRRTRDKKGGMKKRMRGGTITKDDVSYTGTYPKSYFGDNTSITFSGSKEKESYTISSTTSDGNCFYDALAKAKVIENKEAQTNSDVRKKIASFIEGLLLISSSNAKIQKLTNLELVNTDNFVIDDQGRLQDIKWDVNEYYYNKPITLVDNDKQDMFKTKLGEGETLITGPSEHMNYDDIRNMYLKETPYDLKDNKKWLIKLDKHFATVQDLLVASVAFDRPIIVFSIYNNNKGSVIAYNSEPSDPTKDPIRLLFYNAHYDLLIPQPNPLPP